MARVDGEFGGVSYHPQYITKYFSKDMLNYYQAGKFKLGTLEEYRGTEKDTVRLSDDREGISQLGISPENGHFDNFKSGGLHFANVQFTDCKMPLLLTSKVNEWLFCSSLGPYDVNHHKNMLFGAPSDDETHYLGDESLTHYAVIRTDRFIRALITSIDAHPKKFTSLPAAKIIWGKKIKYDNPMHEMDVSSDIAEVSDDMRNQAYLRMIFVKPKRFSPEREYRIVLRLNSPRPIKLGESPIFLKSEELQRSIITTGMYNL